MILRANACMLNLPLSSSECATIERRSAASTFFQMSGPTISRTMPMRDVLFSVITIDASLAALSGAAAEPELMIWRTTGSLNFGMTLAYCASASSSMSAAARSPGVAS